LGNSYTAAKGTQALQAVHARSMGVLHKPMEKHYTCSASISPQQLLETGRIQVQFLYVRFPWYAIYHTGCVHADDKDGQFN
jgi:hypothetical protein